MKQATPFDSSDSNHAVKNTILSSFYSRDKALKAVSFFRWQTDFEKIGKAKGINLVGAFCQNGHFVEPYQFLDYTHRYYCETCRRLFSPVYGTLFEQSRVPLWKWFIFICLYYDVRSERKIKIPSGRKIAAELRVSNKTGSAMKKEFEENLKTEKKFISRIFYGVIDNMPMHNFS